LDVLNAMPAGLAYLALGLSAFVENIFPPIPGDTITVFGAFLVGTRRLSFWAVYVSTTLGSLAGFLSLYGLAMLAGRRLFGGLNGRFFRAQDIRRAQEWFRRYGYAVIAVNRFLPGLRSVISVAGGLSTLRPVPVALLALVSAGLWNLIWMGVGYGLGTQWEQVRAAVGHIMRTYQLALLAAAAVVGAIYMLWRLRRRKGKNV